MSAEAGPSTPGSAMASTPATAPPALLDVRQPVAYHFDDHRRRLSDKDASAAMEKVVASIVRAQGYEGIEASALNYIMTSVESVMNSLLQHAQDLSLVGRRRTPSARDCFIALQHAGPRIQPRSLDHFAKSRAATASDKTMSRKGALARLPDWCTPYDTWLPSDEEDDPAIVEEGTNGIAKRKRRKEFRPRMEEVPNHLPDLPPKHTWMTTPSFPVRSEDTMEPMALIDIKVSATRLTEASLRNLISTTDHAAFNSRLHRKSAADSDTDTLDAASQPGFKTDVFSNSARPDSSRKGSLSGSRFVVPASIASTPPATDEKRIRTKTMKGRALSLRLRTPSSSNTSEGVPLAATAATPPPPENGQEDGAPPPPLERITIKRPYPPFHRSSLSLSISGTQTAPRTASGGAPMTAVGPRRRQTTTSMTSQGPWSAMPAQSYFTWGPPTPGMTPTGELLPLATPLTPSGGFNYPPTPNDLYNNVSDVYGGRESPGTAAKSEADVSLPGVVNYKRSWYKKSHAVVNREAE